MDLKLSNNIRSMTKEVKKRYLEKIFNIDCNDPYFMLKDPSIEWSNNLDLVLDVTYPDIFNYLVLTKSAYTLQEFKAYKSLEAYNFFVSGWISNVKWLDINNNTLVVSEVSLCLKAAIKNVYFA